MAYARLPLADFQAKYPAFASLTDAPYAAWAADAELEITDRYGDYQQKATELLTAHLLATNGVGMGATSSIAATGATSFKSGIFSATLSEAVVAQRAKGGLGATAWGQQLRDIQRRLFGGPMLVGCV